MCFVQVESVYRPNESGEGDSREQRHRVKGERRVELMDGTGAVGVRYGRGSDGMAPTLSYLKITKRIDSRVHFRCEFRAIFRAIFRNSC